MLLPGIYFNKISRYVNKINEQIYFMQDYFQQWKIGNNSNVQQ